MKCEFCKKTFVRESSFFKHACAKKKRWIARNEPYAKLAYQAWLRFHEITGSAKKERLYKEFITKTEFKAFEDLANYILSINPVSKSGYITYIFEHNIPANKWCSDNSYHAFLKEYIRKETPEVALTRSLKFIDSWSYDNQSKIVDFFKEVHPGQAVTFLRLGRLSPWMLYLCESANFLLERFSEEQVLMIQEYLDPKIWNLKMKRHELEVKNIRMVLEGYGI